MIYFASYAEPSHHHGMKIAVTESIPDGFECNHFTYLAPPKGTRDYWERVKNDHNHKPDEKDWDLFKTGYRIHFKKVLAELKDFLEFIEPSEDITFLSWEPIGEYSHRNLIATYIEAKYPMLFGGCDLSIKKLSTIGVGSTVTHTIETTMQSKWQGVIVWMHDSRTYADVLWDRPEVEEITHPIYSNKSYNRINRPERFPVKLLKLI